MEADSMSRRGNVISTHLSTTNGELNMVYKYANGELKIVPFPILTIKDRPIPRPVTTRDGDFY